MAQVDRSHRLCVKCLIQNSSDPSPGPTQGEQPTADSRGGQAATYDSRQERAQRGKVVLPEIIGLLQNQGMELSGSEVVALMAAAVLLNAIGFVAWKRGAVGQWYLYAAGLVVVALLAGDEHNPWLLSYGAIAAFALGLYGLTAWIRHRQRHVPEMQS